jgi:hypothetical protein
MGECTQGFGGWQCSPSIQGGAPSAILKPAAVILRSSKGGKDGCKSPSPHCCERSGIVNPANVFFASVPFMAMCPTCKESRLQSGDCALTLWSLLKHQRPIETYCVICKQFWPITAQERVRLAREIERLQLIG